MTGDAKEYLKAHEEWLYRRFIAAGRAQGRYLFLLMVGCAYTFVIHISPSDRVAIPVLGIDAPQAIIAPFAVTFLAVVLLAFYGGLEAATFYYTVLVKGTGVDKKTLPAHFLDIEANLLDYLIAASHVGLRRSRLSLFVNLTAYSTPLLLILVWVAILWWNSVFPDPLAPWWLVPIHLLNTVLLLGGVLRTVEFVRERTHVFRSEYEDWKGTSNAAVSGPKVNRGSSG